LKVLFLDQFSQPGGAQKCLMDLLPEVLLRGWSPVVMVPGTGPLISWSRDAGIPTESLPLRSYSSGGKGLFDAAKYAIDLPRMAASVSRAIRKYETDLIYVNGPRVLPAVRETGRPVVYHTHNAVAGRHVDALLRWSLRRTRAKVISISKYVSLKEFEPRLIYNGVPDLSEGVRSFDDEAPRIGIIGRIAPEKGQLDFVRAAGIVTERHPRVEWTVYGEDLFSGTDYSGKVKQAAEGATISFRGWVDDVGAALRSLDILVVPSGPHEPATRVVMEAFSAGTPVVAYASGGIPELVEDGCNGILAKRSTPEDLANSICRLLDDRALMRCISIEGRATWRRRFTVDRFRKDVCDFMQEVVSSARHSGPGPKIGTETRYRAGSTQ
jgi:glycosyltransferase involved in cell wall biosynthesis